MNLFAGGFGEVIIWPSGGHGGLSREDVLKSQETICSIVAAEAGTGLFGIAVVSSSVAVGKTVPFTAPYVGAMAVQGYTSPYFGIAGMKMLREGMRADEVLESVLAGDPIRESRQILVVDAAGKTAVYSGGALPEYTGALEGEGYCVGGVGLGGREVLEGCAKAFWDAGGDFAERLVAAVGAAASEANKAAFESAAVRISKETLFPYIDLRVDSHEKPVKALKKLLDLWRGGRNGG